MHNKKKYRKINQYNIQEYCLTKSKIQESSKVLCNNTTHFQLEDKIEPTHKRKNYRLMSANPIRKKKSKSPSSMFGKQLECVQSAKPFHMRNPTSGVDG